MIVIEMTDEKFGKAMKAISCMEEKLSCLKNIFESDYRTKKRYEEDEEEDIEEYSYRTRKPISRYV